jgi:hypothetical protein
MRRTGPLGKVVGSVLGVVLGFLLCCVALGAGLYY